MKIMMTLEAHFNENIEQNGLKAEKNAIIRQRIICNLMAFISHLLSFNPNYIEIK